MSLRIQVLSGFGGKAPAAVRVSQGGTRLLLDAGGPLYPGQRCDWYRGLDVDAVLLSHDHFDHLGAVAQLSPEIPLYCTPAVARALPPGREWQPLPYRGRCEIAGVGVTTGLAGHSLGGVWIHLDVGSGVFYSGDASLESLLFPFDTPPPAATALIDASYGLYDDTQADCRAALAAELATGPAVLPAPPSGRALELALWLHGRGHAAAGVGLDEVCRDWLAALLELPAGLCRPAARARLAALREHYPGAGADVLVVADESAPGAADWSTRYPRRGIIHTGYLPPHLRDQGGRVRALRWNVHPRARDLPWLADRLGARRVVPLFSDLEPVARWRELLGPRLAAVPELEMPDAHAPSLRLHAPR